MVRSAQWHKVCLVSQLSASPFKWTSPGHCDVWDWFCSLLKSESSVLLIEKRSKVLYSPHARVVCFADWLPVNNLWHAGLHIWNFTLVLCVLCMGPLPLSGFITLLSAFKGKLNSGSFTHTTTNKLKIDVWSWPVWFKISRQLQVPFTIIIKTWLCDMICPKLVVNKMAHQFRLNVVKVKVFKISETEILKISIPTSTLLIVVLYSNTVLLVWFCQST